MIYPASMRRPPAVKANVVAFSWKQDTTSLVVESIGSSPLSDSLCWFNDLSFRAKGGEATVKSGAQPRLQRDPTAKGGGEASCPRACCQRRGL